MRQHGGRGARRLRYSGRVIRPHAAQIRVVGTVFLRQRPLVTLPLAIANLALFAAAGAPATQLVAIAVGFSVVQAMFVIERMLGARRPFAEAALARSLGMTALGLAAGCAITGGLASPVVPVLLAPAGIAFAAFGRARASAIILGIVVVAAAALACLPAGTPFPPLASPYRALATALGLVASAILLRLGVATLAEAHAGAAASLGRAGDDAALAAAARTRELDAIGAQVAHEVKNPLAAIRALVEVMREAGGADAERDGRRLAVVAGEVERIERILGDYLDHHRPHAALELAEVDLSVLVRDVAALLEARADRAGIGLTATGPALPGRVDPRRLKEAILNLALNALDAVTPGESIVLRWRADGDQRAIEIVDTGRGMTAEQLARLGTTGFSTRGGGSGLGVVLARAVIEQHGGRLGFSSEPGRGTIAEIRLPWPPS